MFSKVVNKLLITFTYLRSFFVETDPSTVHNTKVTP